jgi:hypothetical protein
VQDFPLCRGTANRSSPVMAKRMGCWC